MKINSFIDKEDWFEVEYEKILYVEISLVNKEKRLVL